MDSIREWLRGARNYAVGVALYNAYGKNTGLKGVFAQGESDFRKKALAEALKEICDGEPVLPAKVAPKVAGGGHEPVPSSSPRSRTCGKHQPTGQKAKETPKSPERGLELKEDPYHHLWHPLYKEMLTLHSRLAMYADDTERGAAAFRILELERACRYYWYKREYYLKTGTHMPDDSGKPDMVTDPNALRLRLHTLRTYITKYKKKLAEDPHNIKAQEKLNQYTAEKNAIEQKLSAK